jgi:hypothetical protein
MSVTINLSWPANPESEGIQKYQVFQSVNNGIFSLLGETAVNSFQIVNPVSGQYRWKVKAVNFVGTGPESNIADGPGLPTQVGDIVVTVVNS